MFIILNKKVTEYKVVYKELNYVEKRVYKEILLGTWPVD